MTTHTPTPTPWRVAKKRPLTICEDVKGSAFVIAECATAISTISPTQAAANASLIVRAVNHHAALVEALERLIADYDSGAWNSIRIAQARATLKAAKAEG